MAGWSDSSWTDPEYDRLFKAQATAVDRDSQVKLVQQMQQIAYVASPYLIFGYPQSLEAYDTADWTGYVKVPGGYPDYNGEALGHDTYVGVERVAAATSTAQAGSKAWIWIVVAVVVVVVILAVVLLRRRGPEVEA